MNHAESIEKFSIEHEIIVLKYAISVLEITGNIDLAMMELLDALKEAEGRLQLHTSINKVYQENK